MASHPALVHGGTTSLDVPSITPDAVRARRRRARARQGLASFHVLASKRRLVRALVASGRLAHADVATVEIERELLGVLDDFATRWLGKEK